MSTSSPYPRRCANVPLTARGHVNCNRNGALFILSSRCAILSTSAVGLVLVFPLLSNGLRWRSACVCVFLRSQAFDTSGEQPCNFGRNRWYESIACFRCSCSVFFYLWGCDRCWRAVERRLQEVEGIKVCTACSIAAPCERFFQIEGFRKAHLLQSV